MTEVDVSMVKFCACSSLRRATRVLTLYYDQFLEPSDIHITQFTFLVKLAKEGSLNVKQLAEMLTMDQTTVTRNLNQLEEKGLIERVTGGDKRNRVIGLTDKGRQTLSQAIPLWEQAQAQIIAGMGEEPFRNTLIEISTLINLTQRF